MRNQGIWTKAALGLVLIVGLSVPAAQAAGLEDYELRKAIPADVYMVVHARQHDGMDFLQKQYERLWDAINKARFDRDIKRLMRSLLRDANAEMTSEEFEAQWQQMIDLATAVDWASLPKEEMAMAMKLSFPTQEMVMLMKSPSGKVESNFEGLSGIAQKLVGMTDGQLKLTTEEDGDTVIHRISAPQVPMPFGLMLAKHEGVILFGMGSSLPTRSLEMLRGNGPAPLCESERFLAAVRQMPNAKDSLMFLDIDRMFTQMRTMIGAAMSTMPQPSPDSPEYETMTKVRGLPDAIFDAFDMYEYMVATSTTDGMKTHSHAVVRLKDNAKQAKFYDAFFGNEEFDEPLSFVPQGAENFTISTGVNIPALYRGVIEIIREHAPNSEEIMAQINSMPEVIGYDIEKDIIAWMGARMVSVTVPGPTKYSPQEWALLLSVRDQEKASKMIGEALNLLASGLAQQGGSVQPVEINGAEGFQSLVMPQMAMMMGGMKPTLGVHEKWLVLGSSPEMLESLFATMRGEEASIARNQRFQDEGLAPVGRVMTLSFADQTKLGDQLAQLLQMVPMLGMSPEIAQNQTLMSLISMAGKAGSVVKKLDFLKSTATRSTRDGVIIKSETVQHYRDPDAPAGSPGDAGSEG